MPPSLPTYTVDPSQPQAGTNYTSLSALLAAVTLSPGDMVEISTASSYSDTILLTSMHSGATGNPSTPKCAHFIQSSRLNSSSRSR